MSFTQMRLRNFMRTRTNYMLSKLIKRVQRDYISLYGSYSVHSCVVQWLKKIEA
jgi:uncharacterized protein YutD